MIQVKFHQSEMQLLGENPVRRCLMPQRNLDGKQFELPMFAREVVPVPPDRQKELESAIAELLLNFAKTESTGNAEGGPNESPD